MMFAPFCPTHDTTVLMTRRNVMGFWNGPDGPVIHWKCTCGHEGISGRTGDVALDRANHAGESVADLVADLVADGSLSARGRTSSGQSIRV